MGRDGTPILVSGGDSRTLRRLRMDGTENAHNEKWLQKLIHRHPTCIPMDQIEPGLSTLVPVCMELPLSCGFLDNLLMTPDGDIVIIEAKLWRNPEARREVVAQALDYASSLFGMDYDSLEKAVLKADFDNKEKPARLYDIFSDADTLDEPAFVDAVTTNLKNGRIVVLVAGDGIRTSIETLIDGLQLHAGFHFTFALVELAVFRGMDDDDFLVVPRTLAKTCMIERGIVRIDNGQVEIVPVQGKPEVASSSRLQSISSEQFYEAMKERASGLPESLKAFVDKLSALGVYPEFQRSLNLKWDPPSGKPINLGYIKRTGQLWTDAASWSLSDKKLARSYIEDLAEIFGGEIMYIGKDKIPYVAVEGHAPRIETLVDKLDVWHGAIEKLQDHVRQNISTEG